MQLNVSVAKSTENRRKQCPGLVALITSIPGATELPKPAADRLNKVRAPAARGNAATPHGKDYEELSTSTKTRTKATQEMVSELDATVTKATEIPRKARRSDRQHGCRHRVVQAHRRPVERQFTRNASHSSSKEQGDCEVESRK